MVSFIILFPFVCECRANKLRSNVSFASLPLFVPTIISEMGSFTTIQSNGLSAPPYLFCFFVIIILCWLSDRFKMRGPFVALAATVAAIGFIINATTYSTAPRYTSVFLSVCIFASVALLLAWTANMHTTDSKRGGGYTILATIGQCGPLLGECKNMINGDCNDTDVLCRNQRLPSRRETILPQGHVDLRSLLLNGGRRRSNSELLDYLRESSN